MRQEEAAPAASAAPVRIPRWAYPLVTVASLLVGAEAIVRGTRAVQSIGDSDLTNFFFKSADFVLRGDPWHMYAVRDSVFTTYPNYNPPLSIFLMAPLLGLARVVGFAANFGEQITFVSLPFMIFVPLLGILLLRALRALYPQMPETQRMLAFVLVVLSPLTWQSIATWYHLEQPMMLCFLVAALIAFQARHEGLAGVLGGLALLSRTTALIPLIAVGVLLIAGMRWQGLLKLGGATAAVVVVGLAPFFVSDRADFLYSFVSWRGTASIGGNSVWDVFACSSCTGVRYALDAVARRLDMYTVVLFVAVAAFAAARHFRISAYDRDAWAVMAIAALAVPMLSKTNWPYYYLEPFIFMLIWEFTSMHDRLAGVWRWPVLSFGFLVVAATLSQYIGLRSVGTLDRIGLGLLEFGAMLAFAVAIWMRMRAARPKAAAVQTDLVAQPALVSGPPPPAAPSPRARTAPGAPAGTNWPARLPLEAPEIPPEWQSGPGHASPGADQQFGMPEPAGRSTGVLPPEPPAHPARPEPPPAATPNPWQGRIPSNWAGAFGLEGTQPEDSHGGRHQPPRR